MRDKDKFLPNSGTGKGLGMVVLDSPKSLTTICLCCLTPRWKGRKWERFGLVSKAHPPTLVSH
jgi:hypothetical protein